VSTISTDNGSQDKNKHPFLSRIGSYITYEEIYGSSISLNEIIDLIRSLPLKYWCVVIFEEIRQGYNIDSSGKIGKRKLFRGE